MVKIHSSNNLKKPIFRNRTKQSYTFSIVRLVDSRWEYFNQNLFTNSFLFLQCKENQKLGAVYFHLHFIMYLSSILCVIRNVIHACVYRLSLLCHCRKIVKSEIRKEGNLNENGKNEFGKEYNCTTSLVNSTKLQLLFY